MIGFQEEYNAEDVRPDEGYETKRLSKKELYEMISRQYMLPPLNSKGVTRGYLLKVHKGDVFRVSKNEMKHFEVDLTPEMQIRVGTLNNAILVKKLNILLEASNRPQLGFCEYEIPDQVV